MKRRSYSNEPYCRDYDGNEQRRFYLVQRIYESPRKRFEEMGFKNDANPFGYGRLGNYELEYMGSAEFEWGAIPESLQRFSDAHEKNDIMRGVGRFRDQDIVFCYIGSDGDPHDDFLKWITGEGFREPFDGKERPSFFAAKLLDPVEYAKNLEKMGKYHRETVVWWSLDDDIMWSFLEDDGSSHLEKMLNSMGETSPQQVRDFSGAKVKK